MDATIQALLAGSENDIQVSGRENFPERRWREAILYYLFGSWSGNSDVTYRPKIIFGSLTLRLDPENGKYFAYGRGTGWPSDMDAVDAIRLSLDPRFKGIHIICSDRAADVERGLIRFVKNNRIKYLRIDIETGKEGVKFVFLWKKERRGEYGIASFGIPESWDGLGAVGSL